MQTRSAKIFGIGLSKTGTTSLARALEMLGYRTRDYLGISRYRAGDLSCIDLQAIDANDAFTDTPIPSFYRELDQRYPGSKFILTTRDMDAWLKSCKKQFTERITARQNEATAQLHTDLYGCFAFDAEKYASGYTRYVEGVLEYFADRPQDLLVLDICGGDNWERLCGFLGKPVPEMPFPVTNVSAIQWMDIQKIVAIARQAGREISRRYGKGFPTASGGGPVQRLRELFSTVLGGTPADDAGRLQKAAGMSRQIIAEGLHKMNPSIPLISPDTADRPFAEREKQPYIWLVDPIGVSPDSPEENAGFSISIALVEGGRPVWGVVYDPREDSIYYAKGASGAWRVGRDGEALKLVAETPPAENRKTVLVAGNGEMPRAIRTNIDAETGDCRLLPAGRAIGLCRLAAGNAAMLVSPATSMEWETAAAHAIARAAGKRVRDCSNGDELRYNKPDLRNGCFIAE